MSQKVQCPVCDSWMKPYGVLCQCQIEDASAVDAESQKPVDALAVNAESQETVGALAVNAESQETVGASPVNAELQETVDASAVNAELQETVDASPEAPMEPRTKKMKRQTIETKEIFQTPGSSVCFNLFKLVNEGVETIMVTKDKVTIIPRV